MGRKKGSKNKVKTIIEDKTVRTPDEIRKDLNMEKPMYVYNSNKTSDEPQIFNRVVEKKESGWGFTEWAVLGIFAGGVIFVIVMTLL